MKKLSPKELFLEMIQKKIKFNSFFFVFFCCICFVFFLAEECYFNGKRKKEALKEVLL